jgi:hypothetical protein
MKDLNFLILPDESRKCGILKKFFHNNFPDCKCHNFHAYDFNSSSMYYGFNNGKFVSFSTNPNSHHISKDTLILTLEEARKIFEKPYPKLMLVSKREDGCYEERMVLGKFGKRYLAIVGTYGGELTKDADYNTACWLFAKDILPKPKKIEITLTEIAEKFNINKEQIKIVRK